ncbi:MAG TPA: right-handed parallel beta-helix repeat-containing protein [Phycisphaerae bacterium]|nr:right-handed parallel beta-helix repeat-containing protein [Phycisphaerae bacterium]
MEFIRWDPNFDGNTLTIRNVEGLKIIGKGEQPVRLLVRPRYVFVLNFEHCKDVEMVNLVMGHAPQEGYCDSGVLGVVDCERMCIRQCELFGCGTEGLRLVNVRSFSFEDSVIRDCTYGILTAKNCAELSFVRTRFTKNREFWGVSLHDTKGVVFDGCAFRENKSEAPLFHVTSCSEVVVTGGEIADNEVKGLTNNSGVVSFNSVGGVSTTPSTERR